MKKITIKIKTLLLLNQMSNDNEMRQKKRWTKMRMRKGNCKMLRMRKE